MLKFSGILYVGMNVAYMKLLLELPEESKARLQKGHSIHQQSRLYASKLTICTWANNLIKCLCI